MSLSQVTRPLPISTIAYFKSIAVALLIITIMALRHGATLELLQVRASEFLLSFLEAEHGLLLDGFKGFCSVFVTAAFAFSGTELVGLAAAETQNPRRALPHATKQVFWRIVGNHHRFEPWNHNADVLRRPCSIS